MTINLMIVFVILFKLYKLCICTILLNLYVTQKKYKSMDVESLCISKEFYPRFSYASKNISNLERRCHEAMQTFGIKNDDCVSNHTLDSVNIQIIKSNNETKFLLPEDIVVRNVDTIKNTKTIYYENFEQFSNGNEVDFNGISIVIASSSMKDKILTLKNGIHFIIIVAKCKHEENSIRKELMLADSEMIVDVSTKESLASDISIMLETITYQPLKSVYEKMNDLLYDLEEQNQRTVSGMEFGKRDAQGEAEKAQKELTDHDKDTIDSLCEEILALYEISNVPERCRPKVGKNTEIIISKEIRDDIFSQCKTIKAVGFHFDKLLVYVEEVSDKALVNNREQNIRTVLEKHGVSNYAISTVSGQLTELMQVGSLVDATAENPARMQSGTLGCFADIEKEEFGVKTCILVSRHVVEGCNKIYLFDKGTHRFVATVLPETTKHEYGSLDIAAAEVNDDVKIEKSARQLKDSEGHSFDGTLCEGNDGDKLFRKGRKVHIWGSKSRPGFGIVTDVKYFIRGMDASLIQIQDVEDITSENGQPFAIKGDSGSIVCTDDPDDMHVNALAMLMGLSNQSQIDEKSAFKRRYLSLPLKEGVQQLEKKTNSKFTLF